MSNPTLFGSGNQTATISTEHIIATISTQGTFVCNIDTVNLAAGDEVEFRAYHISDVTTSRVMYVMAYYGAQPTDDIIKTGLPIGNTLSTAAAVKYTIKQRIGTGRVFPWEVLQYQ